MAEAAKLVGPRDLHAGRLLTPADGEGRAPSGAAWQADTRREWRVWSSPRMGAKLLVHVAPLVQNLSRSVRLHHVKGDVLPRVS